MSVGFLHTPNFAAFWPKPRKKQGFWDNPPLQMSGTSRNRKILGQCASIMQTVLHLTPPCRCQAPVPKPEKNIEKSKDFVQNQKKPREIEKKKTRDNVLVSCKHSVGQIVVFLVFSDFSRFLSVLDKIFRFLDVFFDFGWFLSNSQCFF